MKAFDRNHYRRKVIPTSGEEWIASIVDEHWRAVGKGSPRKWKDHYCLYTKQFWGQFNKTCTLVIYKCSHCLRVWIGSIIPGIYSLIQAPRWSGQLNWKSASTKIKLEETGKTSFFLFPAPPTFRTPFTFASSPLSESLEQAIESRCLILLLTAIEKISLSSPFGNEPITICTTSLKGSKLQYS